MGNQCLLAPGCKIQCSGFAPYIREGWISAGLLTATHVAEADVREFVF